MTEHRPPYGPEQNSQLTLPQLDWLRTLTDLAEWRLQFGAMTPGQIAEVLRLVAEKVEEGR